MALHGNAGSMGDQSKVDEEWASFTLAFARHVQRLRIERNYSQDQVAYAAGISRSSYQRLERGETLPGSSTNPSLRNLIAVAQVLEVSLDELMPDTIPDLREGTPRASKPRKR